MAFKILQNHLIDCAGFKVTQDEPHHQDPHRFVVDYNLYKHELFLNMRT